MDLKLCAEAGVGAAYIELWKRHGSSSRVIERESLPQLGSVHAAATFGRERRQPSFHSLIQKICLRCYRGLLGGSAFASLCACVERERQLERERERERERETLAV